MSEPLWDFMPPPSSDFQDRTAGYFFVDPLWADASLLIR